jgi:hypothetical protein
MLIKGNADAVYAAARAIGVRAENTGHNRYRLYTEPDCVWRRVSPSGRRVSAICWHGFRDFFRELFRLDPSARVKTALAEYTAETFEHEYRKSATRAGIVPTTNMVSLCTCPERGHLG